MYDINKIIWALVNPLSLILVGFVISLIFFGLRRKRFALFFCATSLLTLYILSTPALTLLTGRTLECMYPYVASADFDAVDAIICLGGGLGESPKFCPEPLLNGAADRPYYSSKLWMAGKAPIIILSGVGVENTDARFLLDLGVPETAIVVENRARNTEENARYVECLIKERQNPRLDGAIPDKGKTKALLVTSAWHMKRSLLMFNKYAQSLDVVPAATDHECLRGDGVMKWGYLLPSATCIEQNTRYIHEWLGWACYKYMRS